MINIEVKPHFKGFEILSLYTVDTIRYFITK
jgi:hypothetical protein